MEWNAESSPRVEAPSTVEDVSSASLKWEWVFDLGPGIPHAWWESIFRAIWQTSVGEASGVPAMVDRDSNTITLICRPGDLKHPFGRALREVVEAANAELKRRLNQESEHTEAAKKAESKAREDDAGIMGEIEGWWNVESGG